MKISKGVLLFWGIAVAALSISIGWDYLIYKFIEISPHYTIGTVIQYRSFARETNNRIEYFYNVNGKRFNGKFRSSSLPTNLEGKRILIKFSTKIKSFNQPIYTEIAPDSIQVPDRGWDTLPHFDK